MATMFNIGFLENNFLYMELFGQNWIIPLTLAFLFTIVITRKPNQLGTVFLPVIVSLRTAGLYFSMPIYIATVTLGGLTFILNALGTEVIGSSLRATFTDTRERIEGKRGFWDSVGAKREKVQLSDMGRTTAMEKLADFRASGKTRRRERALALADRGIKVHNRLNAKLPKDESDIAPIPESKKLDSKITDFSSGKHAFPRNPVLASIFNNYKSQISDARIAQGLSPRLSSNEVRKLKKKIQESY